MKQQNLLRARKRSYREHPGGETFWARGKSTALHLLAERLRALPDVLVGTVEHPQSRTTDFYRELGHLFAVPLAAHNRWAGFKAPRARWADDITQRRCRPALIVDEAQEALATVRCEPRILASKELDSNNCFCVVFAGDARLPERLRSRSRAGRRRSCGR